MLEQFYYENHKGEIFTFGTNGVFVDYNDLVDYEWKYDTDNDRIHHFRRGVVKKTLPAIFVGKTGEACRTNRNRMYAVMEKDVLAEQPGKMHVGDYYMHCYVYGMTNSDFHYSERFMKTSLVLATDDPAWHREMTHEYTPVESEELEYGFNYPYDFPFDFQVSRYITNQIRNEFDFTSDFVLTFYGACENPAIQIGGHTYAMNCKLSEGERVVITSRDKTITKYGQKGSEQNYFPYRYKPESIFERVEPGKTPLAWTGKFGFDLTLIDSRSEPPWTYSKSKTASVVGIQVEAGVYYLLDSNGDRILDMDGDPIIVSG